MQPVGADSGAIGGNKSEEFMLVSDIGEDNILFDVNTGRAFNAELLDKENYEEYLSNVYGINDIKSLEKERQLNWGIYFN